MVKLWPLGSGRKITHDLVAKAIIPPGVVKDFEEAALIEDLSPAASATLARRCLQSILQDKFPDLVAGMSKLKRQVEAVLKGEKLPAYLADGLHAIRSVGNAAAHASFDPDSGQIVEVEQGEAGACLDAVQDLVNFLYVDPFHARLRKEAREKKYGSDTK